LVQLIAEVLRVGRCCLVPQLRIEVVASPFAGDASTISVKGFWWKGKIDGHNGNGINARDYVVAVIDSAFQPEAPQQNVRGSDGDRTAVGQGTRWLSRRAGRLCIKRRLLPDPLRPMPTAGQALFCLLFSRFTKE
jgi:hypothetical protein